MGAKEKAAGRMTQAAQVVQLHAKYSPSGWPRQQPALTPTLLVQFHAPVHYWNIRGLYAYLTHLEAPIIYWGHHGRCWAFLHDFTPQALSRLMVDSRAATVTRRGPYHALS